MAEVSLSSLDPRLQKQAENARLALERGNADYALQITGDILHKHPGCLQVRRIQRAAQKKILDGKSRLFAKLSGTMTSAPFMLTAASQVKKDPAAALENAEKLLANDPTNITALRLEAEAATALEFHETAVFCWETIRDETPDNISVLHSLGEAYIRAGHFENAISLGNKMLKLKPNSNEAQELLRHASVEQSMKKGNWEKEGSYRDKLKDEEQAVTLEQAAKVVTSEEMTWRLISDAYARFEAEPNNLNNILELAESYKKLGDFAKAIEWVAYARATPTGAADTTLEKLESELRLAGMEKEVEALQAKLAETPDDAAVAAELAAKKTSIATSRLEESRVLVERYPNDAGYRQDFGRLLYEAGQVEIAIAQFQAAQRSPKFRIQALAMLGACFDAKGQYDLAVEQLATAKSELSILDDTKKDIIYRLAVCYDKMGKTDQAIAEFKIIYAQDISYRDVSSRMETFYKK